MNIKIKYLIFSNSFFIFAGNLLVPLYALFINQLGFGAEVAGILFGTKFISAVLTQCVMLRLKDRVHLDYQLLKYNYLIRGLAWFSLVFFQNIYLLFLVEIFVGFSEAIGTPAYAALVSENLDKKRHISEWASLYFVSNITTAAASILSGFIVTLFGFPYLFFIMSSLAFTSFLIFTSFKKCLTTENTD